LGAISDWEAVKQYREEARGLLDAVEHARAEHNEPRIQQLQNDMATMVAKINEAVGVGGKLKQANDKRKNIQDGFRNAVNRAVAKIRETDAALADHFATSLTYGNFPKYQSEVPISWEIEPIINR
jgi:C4-dicarboxylate-specific signal transduction histidine kinase